MKTTVLAGIFMLLLGQDLSAQDSWYPANQVTVAWDAVTTLTDDTPIPAGDAVTYSVYMRPFPDGAPVRVVTNIPDLQSVVTFTAEGRYLLGVSASRQPEGETELFESTICWSFGMAEPCTSTDGTFAIKFFLNPRNPDNLRKP